jgi:hypothetical protein
MQDETRRILCFSSALGQQYFFLVFSNMTGTTSTYAWASVVNTTLWALGEPVGHHCSVIVVNNGLIALRSANCSTAFTNVTVVCGLRPSSGD